jgi:uncharacterized protein involved in type VI secretion and phage assembly
VTAHTDGRAQRYFGVYPAIVTNIVDEDSLGRVEVKFPWLGNRGADEVRAWATLLTPYADDDQGFQVMPAVDTQVVVAFEAGELRRPYIVGSSWNGVEAQPDVPVEANDKRLIKTRSGSLLEFDDTEGSAKVTLLMKSGHKLVLDDSAEEVTLAHSNGAYVKIDISGEVAILANSSVDITAPTMNVHAGTANFDGLINCTTLVASANIVSPMYTPGVGNIW